MNPLRALVVPESGDSQQAMMDQYGNALFPDLDSEQQRAFETAVSQLTMLALRVGFTADDGTSLLRCGLSLEELVKYMMDRLTGLVPVKTQVSAQSEGYLRAYETCRNQKFFAVPRGF